MDNLDTFSPLLNFNEFIVELSDLARLEPHESMSVERLSLTMPVEIDICVEDDFSVRFKGGAPTQIIETSIMPVFHSMRLKVISEHGEKR